MDAIDKHEADVASLDERLSIAKAVCFLCGKAIARLNFVTVASPAFTPYHAHAECADAIGGAGELANRVWQAIRAAITGKGETPNPATATVHGGFQ
jgi:hypothetical protein